MKFKRSLRVRSYSYVRAVHKYDFRVVINEKPEKLRQVVEVYSVTKIRVFDWVCMFFHRPSSRMLMDSTHGFSMVNWNASLWLNVKLSLSTPGMLKGRAEVWLHSFWISTPDEADNYTSRQERKNASTLWIGSWGVGKCRSGRSEEQKKLLPL